MNPQVLRGNLKRVLAIVVCCAAAYANAFSQAPLGLGQGPIEAVRNLPFLPGPSAAGPHVELAGRVVTEGLYFAPDVVDDFTVVLSEAYRSPLTELLFRNSAEAKARALAGVPPMIVTNPENGESFAAKEIIIPADSLEGGRNLLVAKGVDISDHIFKRISNRVSRNGTFQVSIASDREYTVDALRDAFEMSADDHYVKSISFRGADLLATMLKVNGPPQGEILVTLGIGAQVRGTIRSEDGRPARNVHVYLIPNPRPRPVTVRSAITDDAGNFVVRAVPPDTYNLYSDRHGAEGSSIPVSVGDASVAPLDLTLVSRPRHLTISSKP